jgi:uroporphyrinogen decarboxylase
VGEALCRLRAEVANEGAVLGFVGAPFTLASYIVEGGSSKNYTQVKRLAFGNPEVLHALLTKLADGIGDYVRYQVRGVVGSDPCPPHPVFQGLFFPQPCALW